MPITDEEYDKINGVESDIKLKSFIINATLKISDDKIVKTMENFLIDKIISFLRRFKIFDKIYKIIKESSFINGVINLADRYLSVNEKITKLSFYNFLSGCGVASSIINFLWWLLEKLGIVKKKKSWWLKIIDGGITIFGYLTGLTMDILDIIFNPIPLIKEAAIIEILLSTVSLGIHLYNLIKY